jgi:hypothetical protein
MKIRNGFVSNSSSSSFVLVGFIPTDEEMEKYEEIFEDYDVAYETSSTNDPVGHFISCGDEYELSELDLSLIEDYKNELIKQFNLDENRIKVYSGIMAS